MDVVVIRVLRQVYLWESIVDFVVDKELGLLGILALHILKRFEGLLLKVIQQLISAFLPKVCVTVPEIISEAGNIQGDALGEAYSELGLGQLFGDAVGFEHLKTERIGY